MQPRSVAATADRWIPKGDLPARAWSALRASFWFTPVMVVLGSMGAALLLVELDTLRSGELSQRWPRLFGAGADGSRAMLSAIATSMATVAGVVFSITIVTLSLTSTQYSPRVLRNFMRDAPTQVVLGVFVGIFAYCLVVLRTIRGGDESAFIPSLSVLGGMVYAFGGVAMLIYFIHHVAQSIQASFILVRIARDTEEAIDHLFPQELGHPPQEPTGRTSLPAVWHGVRARRSGYVTDVDGSGLMALACDTGRVLRIERAVGAFVIEGSLLLSISGHEPPDRADEQRMRRCIVIGSQRTVEKDAAFGLQQLVDVALRALSPGINDSTTACMCIDQLSALLARLAGREMPHRLRFTDGQLRVIALAPDFDEFAALALDPVVRHCRGDVQVLQRVLDALETIRLAASTSRNGSLRERLRELRIEIAAVRPRARSAPLRRQAAALERRLREARTPKPAQPDQEPGRQSESRPSTAHNLSA